MKKKKKRWAIILSILAFLIIWGGYLHHPQNDTELSDAFVLPTESISFDTEKWLLSSHSNDNVRLYMIKDLTINYLDSGIDTTTIKDLLGEPASWNKIEHKYFYHVGYSDQGSLYMVLDLDTNGQYITNSVRPLPSQELLMSNTEIP